MQAQVRNWAVVALLPMALVCYMFSFTGADAKMTMYLGVTAFIILIWALEVLPSVHAAILLPVLYITLGIAPPDVVFKPWLTFLPWASVAGIIFGDILGRTGLAKRIALMCVKVMGGSYTAIAIGLMLAGVILAFLVPAIMARIVIFYAITCGFADAFELKKESRMSSAILMAGFFAATSPATIFMTGSEVNLLGVNVINAKQEILTWNGWLMHNLPVGIIYCGISLFLAHFIKGKETLPPRNEVAAIVREKLQEMGRVSIAELKTLVLLLFGVGMFVVMGPKNGPWLFVLSACLAFFPGFSLIGQSQLAKLNFGFIFFVTGCMAIGFAADLLGVPKMIGEMMSPLLKGQSGMMSVVLSYLAGLGLNFLLTPLAATSSMAQPLVSVAAELGMHPAPFIYSFIYGLEQYILPYEYALFLFFFMEGRMTLSHMMGILAVRMVLALILLVAVACPYWSMLGIL